MSEVESFTLRPVSIKKHSDTEMAIQWTNGESSVIPFTELRYQCRCAVCVDEWTRERKIKRSDVKADVKPVRVDAVGRYAVQIEWNDRHNTGIYPYQLLYEIAKGKGDE